MTDKITSIADAEKAIEKERDTAKTRKEEARTIGDVIAEGVWEAVEKALELALDILRELKASVRRRMQDGNCISCGWKCPNYKKCITCPIKSEELRRVLEGDKSG